jgi:hypothetical protein
MIRFFSPILLALLLSGCSLGKLSLYEKGDLHTRTFLDHISKTAQVHGDHYAVRRNDKGQITTAKHYDQNNKLLEKSHYTYSRKGQLKRHHLTEYFQIGPPRLAREWIYQKGRLTRREEKWFTRARALEKKLTIYYDDDEKPYLEETWGLGNRIESSTEYYYDYKHRLDKSRRNFFYPDGSLRDYWLTIYNDQVLIINEEHYLPDNSLIAFYRYAYHPVHGYREREEVLDSDRNIFISRIFDEYGLLLEEEEMDRDLKLIKRTVFEYNDKHRPELIQHYNAAGKLVKTTKYKQLRSLDSYRTPKS